VQQHAVPGEEQTSQGSEEEAAWLLHEDLVKLTLSK
jgi:hypothetical protein